MTEIRRSDELIRESAKLTPPPPQVSLPNPLRDDHPTILHASPSVGSKAFGWIAMTATVFAWLVVAFQTTLNLEAGLSDGRAATIDVIVAIIFLILTAVLTFSALIYLVNRVGALARLSNHERTPQRELDAHFAGGEQTMTALVPSYAEEPRVVRATMWSAALQEFPSLDVVLLLDDKPHSTDPAVLAKLNRTRSIPSEIQEALSEPERAFTEALAVAEAQVATGDPHATLSAQTIENLYRQATDWLVKMIKAETVIDHADEFFIDGVLLALARDLTEVADQIHDSGSIDMPADEGLTRIRRLVNIFSARLDVFERKRYASLSDEANKAMNLNSYIGLMGRSWVIEGAEDGDGQRRELLRPQRQDEDAADYVVRTPTYLLTLDADSLLVPDYCARLVHKMEQPGNERMAVIQTPYSSYSGAPTLVERIAGMTTDLQHLQHQGRTRFDATFWVGANAVIRTAALDDIVEVRTEQGPVGPREIRTYIQDRTVIEDTESSMDLVANGWSLYNYPERLSYSATPPDFGSLVVQRRRWANGGLIILPKIAEAIRARRERREKTHVLEMSVRADYLVSIASTTLATLMLIVVPAAAWLLSPFMFIIAIPYFATMALDLRASGHKAIHVCYVFALNLVLLPVNLAGVLKSMQQAVTGRKIPFARTPKIRDRVAAPTVFVALPYLLAASLLAIAVLTALQGHWGAVAIAGFTGSAALIGSLIFVSPLRLRREEARLR